MSNLLDKARLTDEERDVLFRTKIVTGGILQREPVIERLFSDAAAAKALWAVVEWLKARDWASAYESGDDLEDMLHTAGIERPKEEP